MYKILKAEKLADKIYLMDVEAKRVAKSCQPGQFVIVKMDETGERIPLTICDYNREVGSVTIVFQTLGESTMRMADLKAGDYFEDFTGPLGCASEWIHEDLEELKKKKMLFVAGGVGTAPVYHAEGHPLGQVELGRPGVDLFWGAVLGGIGGGGRKGDAVLSLLPGDDGQSSDVLYGGDVPQGHLLASLGGDGVVQQGGDIVVLALGVLQDHIILRVAVVHRCGIHALQQIVDLHGHR